MNGIQLFSRPWDTETVGKKGLDDEAERLRTCRAFSLCAWWSRHARAHSWMTAEDRAHNERQRERETERAQRQPERVPPRVDQRALLGWAAGFVSKQRPHSERGKETEREMEEERQRDLAPKGMEARRRAEERLATTSDTRRRQERLAVKQSLKVCVRLSLSLSFCLPPPLAASPRLSLSLFISPVHTVYSSPGRRCCAAHLDGHIPYSGRRNGQPPAEETCQPPRCQPQLEVHRRVHRAAVCSLSLSSLGLCVLGLCVLSLRSVSAFCFCLSLSHSRCVSR